MSAASALVVTWLLNAVWQVALLAAMAAFVAVLAQRAPARVRHQLWVTALLLGVLLPLAALLRPTSLPSSGVTAGPTVRLDAAGAIPAPEASIQPASASRPRGRVLSISPTLSGSIAVAYVLFVAWRVVRLARAYRDTRTLRRMTSLPPPRALIDVVEHCRKALGVNSRVRVVVSPEAMVPLTVGARRPLIVLPHRLAAMGSTEVLSSVLGHEMAHVRRRDFAFNLAYELVALPLSFHPATLYIKGRIQMTRELACDEAVTESLLDPGAYARGLVAVAHCLATLARPACALGMLDGATLEARLLRLLARKHRPCGAASRAVLLAGGLALATAATGATGWSVTVSAEEPSAPATAAAAEENLPATPSEYREAPRPGDFTYDSLGARDPFMNPLARAGPTAGTGLPSFSVDELALRGIVGTPGGWISMIVGPDGKTYFVSVGQRFFDGKLVKIDQSALTFRKEFVAPDGRTLVRDRRLSLYPETHLGLPPDHEY